MSSTPNEYGFDASLEFPSRNLSQYNYKDEFNLELQNTEPCEKTNGTLKIVSLILAALATLSAPIILSDGDKNNGNASDTEHSVQSEQNIEISWNEQNNF